ncbi:MAG: mechanosensitive ion channel [Planctomycetes bacterium]|nr:mechanosensitive ion channel [Planctomycetota bacterium]MBL7044033.1 mechanosensitive ion channel [Pirellulaceae bacterium]
MFGDFGSTLHQAGSRYVGPFAIAVIALTASPAKGQIQPGEKPAVEAVTRETVESRIKEAEESQELAEDTKARIRELYQQALQDLDVAAGLSAQAAAFDDMAVNVQVKLQATKTQLDDLGSTATVAVPEDAAVTDLEQLLKKEEAELSRLKQDLARLDAEPARRQARRTEVPSSATSIRERLANIEKQLAVPAPADEPPLLTIAQQLRGRIQRQLLEQELATGEKELVAYAADATELVPLQRDLAARLVGQSESRVAQFLEMTNRRRQDEARKLAAVARMEAARAHPLLQPEASVNQAFAEQSEKLAPQIHAVSLELERTNQELERVQSEVKTTREKTDRGGLTEGIGLLLRRQLATLPDVRRHRRSLLARRSEMRSAELLLIDLYDARYALSDTEREVERKIAALRPLPADVDEDDLRRALRDLLETRKGLLDKLIQSQDSYFDLLVKFDSAEDELIKEVRAYSEYLRERVLWIRSAQVWSPGDLKPAGEAVGWLLRPDNWSDVGWALIPYGSRVRTLLGDDTPQRWTEIVSNVGTEMGKRPWPLVGSLLFIVYFVLLVANQRRIRRRIGELGDQAARRNCQRFLLTFHALVATVLISLLWPSLLLFLAWRLTTAVGPSDFARAVGHGLGLAGGYVLSFQLLRQICRSKGLAVAHFDWPAEASKLLRSSLRTLLTFSLPFVVVVTSLHGQSNESWQNSLARMCCIAALAVVSIVAHRLFRPNGEFFQAVLRSAPESWLWRLRRVWYGAAVFAPLVLAALALVGYYYTAYALAFRLQQTLWLVLILLVLASLVQRWLLVNRRRLAMDQALERRRTAQAQAAAAEKGTLSVSIAAVATTELDLGEMSQQSRQLLRVSLFVAAVLGMWFIWVDVLPALGILEDVRLWQVSVRDELQWITLEHLVFGLMIVAVMVLAVKNIPGLLELTLLQRLPLDAGARYASTTCIRYLITLIGLIFAFRIIGIEWSQYQWLVAAASVGLGFGLQEIFANFVSGLIVLMERPVRVGDIVTVEGVTGVVSRIRMRATTVTNWDRQEYIVPNKEFVTGRLLNWTLSNAINRVLVNVGVAYGADTERATEVLLSVANDSPLVLDDPPPVATFQGFGDSTLSFVLRCYLPNLDNRLATIHELHTEVHRRFAEAGIEIAFPQRDIHIRSSEPPFVIDDRRAAVAPSEPV